MKINGMGIVKHFLSYMRNERGDTVTTQQQTTPQPTATESALMGNELQLSNAALPGQIQNVGYANSLAGNLMQGQSLPGYLNTLPGGVSPQQSQNMAQMGNQGIATQFQAMGGLDTGSAAQAMAGNYANTLNQNAQFNVQNLAQLMNLASGQSYQNQALQSSNNSMLGTQSGALASTNTTNTTNPFMQSLMSGLGGTANTAGQAGLSALPGGGAFSAFF